MKFTFSWLKEFLRTDNSPEEIMQGLFHLGLEVDSLIYLYRELSSLTVAKIIKVKPHPNADRLKVCEVETCDDDQIIILDIVCGAPNVYDGMKVVLARTGQYIPAKDFTIKETTIRGVKSQGMMCSFEELGLSDFASQGSKLQGSKLQGSKLQSVETNPDTANLGGIIEVENNIAVGAPYLDVLGLDKDEVFFDVTITPNRGDCLSIMNIARDLAAGGYGEFKAPELPIPKSVIEGKIIKDYNICPNFSYAHIKGVKNCTSPKWLQNKLRAIGLKPRSALVDITNYMCYTYGRPMHVFDGSKIAGQLKVRCAKNGETIEALNGESYELQDTDIVVADQEKALAIAGIIGGENSKTLNDTTEIFLESAFFHQRHIALTGQRLNIITDSRFRFERGCDFNLVLPILQKASKLILEICGGELVNFVKDSGNEPQLQEIEFDYTKIKKVTGVDVSLEKSIDIFTSIGCIVEKTADDNKLKVIVPSWRPDITIYQDLVEEVVRIIGYDNIALKISDDANDAFDKDLSHCHEEFALNKQRYQFANLMRLRLATEGAHEVYNWSFAKKTDTLQFVNAVPKELELVNSINADFSTMKQSLLNSLMHSVKKNISKGYSKGTLFEIANVHEFKNGAYFQNLMLSILCYGQVKEKTWFSNARKFDIFDIKAYIIEAFDEIGISCQKFSCCNLQDHDDIVKYKYYHPGHCGLILLDKTVIGIFGRIHPSVLEYYGIEEEILTGEVFLEELPQFKQVISKDNKEFVPSLYPSIKRDISLVVDQGLAAQTVIDTIRQAVGKDQDILCSIELFDIYMGEGIEKGKKSVTVGLEFKSYSFTLQDKLINSIMDRVVQRASHSILASFR